MPARFPIARLVDTLQHLCGDRCIVRGAGRIGTIGSDGLAVTEELAQRDVFADRRRERTVAETPGSVEHVACDAKSLVEPRRHDGDNRKRQLKRIAYRRGTRQTEVARREPSGKNGAPAAAKGTVARL